MDNHWQAMVLAAGFGKRLFPLTRWTPKPLVPLTKKPALFHLLERIQASGINRLAINTHHLSGQIADYVSQNELDMDIEVFYEKDILNTGGGLKNAAPFLEKKPYFLVHNSDILTDFSLKTLMKAHERSGAQVTLALRDDGNRNIVFGKDGAILDMRGMLGVPESPENQRGAYMGIAAFSSSFLKELPDGESDLVDALVNLIKKKQGSVRGEYFSESIWSDLGTFSSFFKTQRLIIDKRSPDLVPRAEPLVEQGSSRRYYRLGEGENTFVLMLCERDDSDFMRFIETSAFLNDLQLGNPQMWAWSQEHFSGLLEDLGDDTLYRLFHKTQNANQRFRYYMKSVQFLVNFQKRARENKQRCPASHDRTLDYEQLRWESRYFCKEFLIGHLGFSESILDQLESEFHALAAEVASHPQTIIHRDFQSQNLLIKEGEVHMVDYQGMRLGSIAYDFMSLVNDPYVELEKEVKDGLMTEFIRIVEMQPEFKAPHTTWKRRFYSAGLQRNMQALGAYAFLSGNKKKTQFLEFMAPGSRILLEGIQAWNHLQEKLPRCPLLEETMVAVLEKLEG